MITFQQFCELETSNQSYAWFSFPVKFLEMLTTDDLATVYLEKSVNGELFRVWYPREKYFSRPIQQAEYQRMIQAAIDSGDMAAVKEIKEKVKII